jgi:hypothetical protein
LINRLTPQARSGALDVIRLFFDWSVFQMNFHALCFRFGGMLFTAWCTIIWICSRMNVLAVKFFLDLPIYSLNRCEALPLVVIQGVEKVRAFLGYHLVTKSLLSRTYLQSYIVLVSEPPFWISLFLPNSRLQTTVRIVRSTGLTGNCSGCTGSSFVRRESEDFCGSRHPTLLSMSRLSPESGCRLPRSKIES